MNPTASIPIFISLSRQEVETAGGWGGGEDEMKGRSQGGKGVVRVGKRGEGEERGGNWQGLHAAVKPGEEENR